MEINVQKCCEILRKMDDIVILTHRNPDGDTLGSAFALHYIQTMPARSKYHMHLLCFPAYKYDSMQYVLYLHYRE